MPEIMEEIVSTPQGLAECCTYLVESAGPALGLDTEFVGEETYHPRLCERADNGPGASWPHPALPEPHLDSPLRKAL